MRRVLMAMIGSLYARTGTCPPHGPFWSVNVGVRLYRWNCTSTAGSQRGGVRVIAESVDSETGAFTIYFSQVYPTDGFSQPPEVGADLVERFGAYVNHPAFSAQAMGWISNETFVQMMEYQNEWLGRAGRHLMETREWDLFTMQSHCIDFANHAFVPRHGWTDEERETNLAYLARCYESVDRMVGELVAAGGDDALVCVVSDHGATESPNPEIVLNAILEEAGLLFYEPQQAGAVRPIIDRTRTVAEQQRAAFIYLNVAGRDPHGIVPPGEYEATRDRVIEALYAYREPKTGRNPFSMILRKEDARILGQFDSMGRDIGDIVYALLPEFDHEHGRQLPGVTLGGQTMKPLVIFRGPGIKAGATLERVAWLVDVVPTIAHATGWPMPSEAEGAVLYQAFDGHTTRFPRPDFMKRQEETLQAVRSRYLEKASKPSGSQAPTPVSQATEAQGQQESEEENIPDAPAELRQALLDARAEARKWKSAYEQYHRITHGN